MAEPDTSIAPDVEPEGPGVLGRLLRWLGAALLVALMLVGGQYLLRLEPRYLPVEVVSVAGEVRRMPREQLQRTVIDHLHGGILTQDLARLKAAVEALPWIQSASIKRIWPNRLELKVREHEPLAEWGEDALVSTAGVVFRPDPEERPRGLPRLTGLDAQAPEVVARYLDWRTRCEAVGVRIAAIEHNARGAWTLQTGDGFTLELGKGEVEERMARFLVAWPSLALAGRPARVDMRYTNGLAVVWAEPAAGEETRTAGASGRAPRNRS
ncbi:MAG: cell division protein FtsQ/DivIB [Chromatiaceae bacterium]|nr:cell division protein FtsQ/DivIB [Chromatiaceae bacterium]